jgi:acyl carrier protein
MFKSITILSLLLVSTTLFAESKYEMTEKAVLTIAKKALRVPVSQINLNTNIVTDPRIDELDLLEMALALEETFAIEITDSNIKSFSTLNSISKFVNQKLYGTAIDIN